jgi:protein phosphatase 1K
MDAFGSWAGKIDLNLEESVRRGKLIPRIELDSIGFDSKRGKRKYQEDRYLIADLGHDMVLAAVFDGHGGDACAQYAAENFVEHVKARLGEQGDDTHLDSVLAEAFESVDRNFAEFIAQQYAG